MNKINILIIIYKFNFIEKLSDTNPRLKSGDKLQI